MALSEYEQRAFAEITQNFAAEEPELVAKLSGSAHPQRVTPALLAGGILGSLLGLLGIFGGVLSKSIPLGVIGFLVLALAIYAIVARDEASRLRIRRRSARPARAMSGRSDDRSMGAWPQRGASGTQKRSEHKPSRGFMKNLEDKWDERNSR